jgi:hypothetical protein
MTANPPEGWYADPHDASGLRYWDGTTWTEHTHRADGADAAAAAAPGADTYAPESYAPSYAPASNDQDAVQTASFAAPAVAQQAQAYGSYQQTGLITDEEPKKKLSSGALIGIIVAGVVILAALIGIIMFALTSGSDDDATSSDDPVVVEDGEATGETPADDSASDDAATDDAATDDSADQGESSASGDAIIPGGWEEVDSPSGAITYAHAPDMEDAGEFIDLDALDAQLSSALPGSSSEVSGMWIDMSATATAGSSVMVMTTDGAVDSDNLSAELEAFAQSASAGAEGIDVGETKNITTAVGYDAASLDYSSTSVDVTSYATVTAVIDGETAVFVFSSATSDAETSSLMNQQVVDSLVINHAP